MKNFTRISLVSIMLFVIVVMAGCAPMNRQTVTTSQGSIRSGLTEAQATEIAENAMKGLREGNYAVWSRDWTDTMKGAIKEEGFLSYREQVIANYGEYQSIASIEQIQSQTKGYVRWSIIANFEKGQIRFNFAFKEDGRLIEGIFPEAVSS
jgi:hypothetical protein